MSDFAARDQSGPASVWTRMLSWLLDEIGARWIGQPQCGAVTVVMPSGRTRRLGDASTGPHATIRLNNFRVLLRGLRRGEVGFADAYIAGDLDCDDLTSLFRFYLQNRPSLDKANPGIFRQAAADFAYHLSRRNTREGARQNIAEHYDLGNAFYAEWLDPTMTYSSAYFTSEDETLEQAQLAKYRRVADLAGVTQRASVLEIGCGWGGFAELAAREYGASVTGITLSNEQLKYARQRIADAGLDNRVGFRFEDYRDTSGQYDHVCSIEMIEAVGEEHWPVYFRCVHDRLKPGGAAAIQAITLPEADFENYRSTVDFIQRYIFPGGMLLTKKIIAHQARAAGLVLENSDCFGLSYARTLRLWREKFMERWPMIARMGFDEIFRRKWIYYLSYCAAGFAEGSIDVG
ncbi:MAG: cyclopropane-fatty-acyl-phospholipid synthase family protein, partial [Cucumibacter sp.]